MIQYVALRGQRRDSAGRGSEKMKRYGIALEPFKLPFRFITIM